LGRKPLQPDERRLSVTIRLDPETLKQVDKILSFIESINTELISDELRAFFKLPKNRTELISWILSRELNNLGNMFLMLSAETSENREELETAFPEMYERIKNDVHIARLQEAIRTDSIQKERLRKINEQVKFLTSYLEKKKLKE